MPALPILYSFRRCPYAMRARFALDASGLTCELREVVLRDKPPELLAASAKATVPVLIVPDGRVLDESMDIMHWALRQNDPGQWLVPQRGSLAAMVQLIAQFDGDFKHHLDRYKYPHHHAGEGATDDHRYAWATLTFYSARTQASLTWPLRLLCASSRTPMTPGSAASPGRGLPAGSQSGKPRHYSIA